MDDLINNLANLGRPIEKAQEWNTNRRTYWPERKTTLQATQDRADAAIIERMTSEIQLIAERNAALKWAKKHGYIGLIETMQKAGKASQK